MSRQLAYIYGEFARYTQAQKLPAVKDGEIVRGPNRLAWNALNLHPLTPKEIQDRLDQLKMMERKELNK